MMKGKYLRFGLFLVATAGAVLFQAGCRQVFTNPIPSVPSVPIGVVWNSAQLVQSSTSYTSPGLSTDYNSNVYASVNLLVNGSPESIAVVSLNGDGGNATLSYTGPATVSGTVYASYSALLAHFTSVANVVSYIPGPVTYVSGQAYTLTTATSAGTASASAVAPGPILNTASPSPLGFNVSWTGGIGNQILVVDNSSGVTTFSASGVSTPVFIPGSDFSSMNGLGGLPGPLGSGDTESISIQQTTSGVSGAASGSTFTIYDSSSGNPA